MNLWESFGGMVRVRLISADPAAALAAVSGAGITVLDAVRQEDDIAIDLNVRRQDQQAVKKIADRKGYGFKIIRSRGVFWTFRRLLNRPMLLMGVLMLFLLAAYLPTRVFFIRIEGNDTIPTRLILEKCEQCGISFGASRSEVRSEKMKNALLEAIPELQWAGINTSGCVATITVKERTDADVAEKQRGVASIIAACDGIITECTVIRGNRVCKVGQAVRAGDLLVSGYNDCGICIQATRAEAEIYALTQRKLTAVIPIEWQQEGENAVTEKKYALIIGKNRINFYKGSGISGATCDKIYSEYYITLPGGFQLPVAIVTEVWSYSEHAPVQDADVETALSDFAQRYLSSRMVAGTILGSSETLMEDSGFLYLQGDYACSEMIAQVRNEEIIKPYGNDN